MLYWCCVNSRYSAPILVNVEYIQGSNAQKNRVEKVLLEMTVSYIWWLEFGYYIKFVLAEWCYDWKNAYHVKEFLLCLTWKRWSWTCKTWFVCTKFNYLALPAPGFLVLLLSSVTHIWLCFDRWLQVSAPLILEDILLSKGQRRCYSLIL